MAGLTNQRLVTYSDPCTPLGLAVVLLDEVPAAAVLQKRMVQKETTVVSSPPLAFVQIKMKTHQTLKQEYHLESWSWSW